MTKEQFLDWKTHSVTQEIFSQLRHTLQEGLLELGASAGFDPVTDAKRSGKILAIQDFLDISFEDQE